MLKPLYRYLPAHTPPTMLPQHPSTTSIRWLVAVRVGCPLACARGRPVPCSRARPFACDGRGGTMAGPFIFISQSRIKEGKLDNFKRSLREMAEFVEANEPRVIAFEAYLNDDSTEVTGVQIHPDADSMAVHMQVAWEKIMEFDQYLDTQS